MESGIALTWSDGGPPVKWRAAVGEGYSSPVALESDVVVFHRPRNPGTDEAESHGPDEVITCFDLESGAPKWHFRHPTSFHCRTHYSSGPYSTPVMTSERVYAFGTEGNFYCLNRADGGLVWKRELWRDYGVGPSGFFPPAGSPLLVGERLIINLGAGDAGAGIIALDSIDGHTLWTATDHGAGYATPCAAMIHGRAFVFVFTAEGLVALDPESGKEYWCVRFRANNPELVNATSPIVYEDIVFTSGFSIGNLCLQIQADGSYKELWRDKRRNLDSQYNPLICLDGWVYGFAAMDDTLRCLDLRTGELSWKGLRHFQRGSAIGVDGHLVVVGTQGHLGVVKIDHRKLHVTAETKKPVIVAPAYSFPALHRKQLLIRNETELVCFDLRGGSHDATGQ